MSNRPGAKKQASGAARVIVPIALVVFAFASFSVISSNDDSKSSKASSSDSSTATKSTKTTTTNGSEAATVTTKTTYKVKSGDSFNSIAEKFNIDVTALTALNSDIDPRALQPGQKLKLK